ncbi:MAG: helix-turn-helix transcriptional regulator [Phreatobacter sp.]|uniref:helix-turn-helix transcriptional regulator n=1 Tax=Phreatobacter sp. TaxID=1966341 RepID=UPI001A62DED2|nr:helix-turn-helix transcriptional regulator [Phreatobacter sp.]MBL8569465.1 helix-turn-helix transcriptional regulator [Phreatobacter sp.]
MQDDTYLTTEETALYLRLKERKLYELVAQGAIPCAKVTGKWLFPRAALDRWIAAGMAQPEGFVAEAPPAIIGGSHDPLLEWAARQSGSGFALLAEGSETGLDRLERNEVAAAAIHLHGQGDGETANLAGVSARAGLHDAVVIAFCRREQGLLVAPGNPLALGSLDDAARRGARVGLRPAGAGAQLLLDMLAVRAGCGIDGLNRVASPYPTGPDLALGLRGGEIDCGIATRAVADLHGVGFVPLLWERFDLVLRRRTFFEPAAQKLFALVRQPAFGKRAGVLGGYDIADAGNVRLNR